MSLACISYSQVVEDFSDDEFLINPAWTSSNDALWEVNAEELQSNSADAATYWISTPSEAANNGTWEFTIRLEFATSGANYVDVFLLSDTEDLTNANNGYYVRIGDTQDEIVLYKLESGNETAIIDGAEGVVNSSSNNQFRIRVTKDTNGDWELQYDDELTGSFTTAGSVIDNSVNSSAYFGFLIVQSGAASPIMSHFFDDILVSGDPFVDTEPPQLLNAEVQETNQILLSFDEDLNETVATALSNYSLNNGYGNPVEVALTASNQVLLTFDTDFVSGEYELVVEDIEDLAGNILPPVTTDFTVFIPDVPVLRNVIITEIFADPSPSIGLPEADFIEIYNNSDKTFDLADWVLRDNAGESILPTYILVPDQYLILCSSTQIDVFIELGETLGLSNFPNFNNSGDQVLLEYVTGEIIDLINYDDSWYGDSDKSDGGYSLESINPNDVCGSSSNWLASTAVIGGTPGTENSIFNSSTGSSTPAIIETRVVNASELHVTLSEPLDSVATSLSNFSINNGITISAYQLAQNSLRLTTNEAFENNISYTLIINDLQDCTGNVSSDLTADFEFIVNPPPNFKDVIITEIMANPNEETTAPNAEYLELYNRSTTDLNLEGWLLADAASNVELPFYLLPANSYVVIAAENDTSLFQAITPLLALQNLPSLNNNGDAITIRNNENTLLDSVNYSASWYRSSIKDDGGFSLELIDLDDFCSDELNWIASEDESGGTPGFQNSVFSSIPDNLGPSLLSTFGISTDTIMLEFDELLDATSISTANYQLSDALQITSISSRDLKTVYLILSESTLLQSGIAYQIEITGLKDCPGNIITSNNAGEFSLIETAGLNDIILNEILFNPISGGVDFVEIYNNSDKYISLKNWSVANGEFELNSLIVNTIREISSTDIIISPNTYKVLTADNIVLKDQYPKSVESNFIELSSLPSYPDKEGLVVLLNTQDSIVDFFNYSEDYHSATITEEEGVSLERIAFNEETNNAENWFSASERENFATPGYINSQSKLSNSSSSGTLSIDPQIISPDGDGQGDFTTVAYALPAPGYVANLRVYTFNGLEVKTIAENDFLSENGFYTWDGSDNNGSVLRIGYYIIYFEAFHSNGDLVKLKKKVVIGSRF